jgi:anti-sigma B factor antagonist
VDITITEYKRCDLIKVAGRIDSVSAPELSETFRSLTDKNRCTIVLDLTDVDFISSAGLRTLIDAQKTCKRWNRGEVVLTGVQASVKDVLDLVGFVPLFQFFDDTTSAVASF